MSSATIDEMLSALVGARLASVERLDFTWFFRFDNGFCAQTDGIWRVLDQGQVAVTCEDHGQLFGLKSPVDAAARAMTASDGLVANATIAQRSGDLVLTFEFGAELELLVSSHGYENWELGRSVADQRLISLGGGKVRLYPA